MQRQPLSQKIAAELRESILSGQRPPGSLMPSERELVEQYNTSKSTANKAIALLHAEGLLDSQRGRGVFVREQPSTPTTIYGRKEIGDMFAVKPNTVSNWIHRYGDTPVAEYVTPEGTKFWGEKGRSQWLSWYDKRPSGGRPDPIRHRQLTTEREATNS